MNNAERVNVLAAGLVTASSSGTLAGWEEVEALAARIAREAREAQESILTAR